jgi:hypothetical protein
MEDYHKIYNLHIATSNLKLYIVEKNGKLLKAIITLAEKGTKVM